MTNWNGIFTGYELGLTRSNAPRRKREIMSQFKNGKIKNTGDHYVIEVGVM